MDNLIEKINKLGDMVIEVTDSFYQQKEKQGYQMFESLYTTLIQVVDQLLIMDDELQIKKNEKNLISQYLIEALQSLENQDVILFADVLRYDVMGLINNIAGNLQSL
ncbi:MAG TPA: hypothetical protein DCE48_01170 [Lachnospiraceae bacterium]|nr:hypothetical protein [Lachnospiraceae bacterium]